MGRDFFDSIMAGSSGTRLTAEQEDAFEFWKQHPWNFLTGVWPLRSTKSAPSVPVYWTFDPDLKKERPMPSRGYEYARDAILDPIFAWKPETPEDKLRIAINKSRKVLGTLWVLSGAGWEVVFQDAVSWKIAKGKREEAQDLIVERLRYAYNHENYPEWLRRYRPVRPKPLARFARFAPGSPPGIFKSIISAVGQNFGTKEAKGGTNDFIIDEAVELESLRSSWEAAAPGARRMIAIATPPEPSGKGKRLDPDSVAFFRELVEGIAIRREKAYPSNRPADADADVDLTDVDLIGAL